MGHHALEPMLGRRVVINVAIDARMDSNRTMALQGGVEFAAALAEVVVGGVAEREHGKFDAAEIEAIAMHDRFPEGHGVIGRFAVAVGADDHQYAVGLHQDVRLALRHVSHPCHNAGMAQRRRQFLRQHLRISGDGPVENENRIAVVGRGGPFSATVVVTVVSMPVGCTEAWLFHSDPR